MYIAVLNAIIQSVIMLSVAMLSVVAPFLSGLSNYGKKHFYEKSFKFLKKKLSFDFLAKTVSVPLSSSHRS